MSNNTKLPTTFQEVITTLNEYWRQRGCLLLQPMDKEVGAGTFHTGTFLRSLGPEPWACAYTQASRRPFDGRYGNNPNRLQHYYQYQVIVKPPPLDILQVYINSLQALGIDPHQNDIRCVEDNWNSPSLGAWGVGWEIWCNGMEVTQFTYFQQVGGIDLNPISCEITYGLERIAMYLQKVNSVYDLIWGHDANNTPIYYRELFQENERQNSHYNFTHANTKALRQSLDQSEQACQDLIKAELPIPAYEQVLDLSHAFNLLEARKALSTLDRQKMILRIRTLSCLCAKAWLDSREAQNFPLCKNPPTKSEK
ncbi:MAG: glycine--tRNA ligase subunit alpha, partial [Proteobacteria bacterium]|nr:glycine--tRNA ligase subunit alpha [Pseudomonadota bacterium]